MGEHAVLEAEPGGQFTLDIKGAPVRGRFLELDPPRRNNRGAPAGARFGGGPPPRRLLISWGYAGSEHLPPGASTVEVRLTADRGGTFVELEHRDLPPGQRPGHVVGWAHYLTRLGIAGAGGDPGPDPGMPSAGGG